MTTVTSHPHFIFVMLSEASYLQSLITALRKVDISSSTVRCTALYVYSTDLLLVRRIVNKVVCASLTPRPFQLPSNEPLDWVNFLTPTTEAWSIRFRNRRFEVWDGMGWRSHKFDSESCSIDLSRLALALSGERYHPRSGWWCCPI